MYVCKFVIPSMYVLTWVRHQLNVIAFHNNFILLTWRAARDSAAHAHSAHILLTQEIPDFNKSSTLWDDNVDWEMGIDSTHLVFVALNTP